MHTIRIDLPPETYRRLEEQARRAGQAPEALSCQLLETALQACEATQLRTSREVLQAANRVRPLGATLRRKIIPGVTLEEVRAALAHTAGPSLSDIISEQRGPRL